MIGVHGVNAQGRKFGAEHLQLLSKRRRRRDQMGDQIILMHQLPLLDQFIVHDVQCDNLG